ncbi:YheC/YheD family protein [Geomicrobium sp. JCM 19039]|uniref:YheC/YheD family protein n=1 Tax=Geomicrobium sp. JCM 19039 TaxID=1460636 RepID=UPI00045F35E3|nr:YheC/YheD family protein [Geomicrobium sp. JCM 19039]GAK13955.1 hypothetical protein JCM19039_3841 [Geomicrobium sp. JCM 19039]
MQQLSDKVITQTVNILETINESLNMYQQAYQDEDIQKMIEYLSVTVEGWNAIEPSVRQLNTMGKEIERIQSDLRGIVEFAENGNMINAYQIIQFSLNHELANVKNGLYQYISSNKEELLVGVYLPNNNPLKVMPENRIKALVAEAKKTNTKLIFFSDEDVLLEHKQVHASVWNMDSEQKETTPFPDVIDNIGMRESQSEIENVLRDQVPFIKFGIGNKLFLPMELVKRKSPFAKYFIPFKLINNEEVAINFIYVQKKVVIKPIAGRQGQSIYFVDKINKHFVVKEHKKKYSLMEEQLKDFIGKLLLEGNYIVQKYVKAQTKKKSPFDIRAHVQKNGHGNWVLTKIYPRIGNKKSILSNISRGGHTEELSNFLRKEFISNAHNLENELINLSLNLTTHIDQIYRSAIDELGLDLTIDANKRIWVHEVNLAPQTTFHEEERAVNTIAYSRFIAKNGIVFN